MPKTVFYVVADFGADPTGTTDSTAAIQSAISAAKSIGPGLPNGIVDLENGKFLVGSLDCTGAATLEIRAGGVGGSVLYANQQTANAPVFDFTGSQACVVRGVSIYAMNPDGSPPAVQPSAGLLWAASVAENDSTKMHAEKTNIVGWFTSAPMCIIGSADNKLDGCDIEQYNGALPALNHSNQPDWYISSPHKPITPGGSNCGDNTFVQCEIHVRNMSPGVGWVHYYRNAYSMRHFGGNSSCNGGRAHMLFQGTCKNILLDGVQFWTETTAPQYVLEDQGSGTRVIAVGCDQGPITLGRNTGPFSGGLSWM